MRGTVCLPTTSLRARGIAFPARHRPRSFLAASASFIGLLVSLFCRAHSNRSREKRERAAPADEAGAALQILGANPPLKRSIGDAQLDLVAVALQLWRVHGLGSGRQRTELARDLRTHPVADRVLAASQRPHEEAHAVVAHFHVGSHVITVVAG